jgi:hypothetical protein
VVSKPRLQCGQCWGWVWDLRWRLGVGVVSVVAWGEKVESGLKKGKMGRGLTLIRVYA